MYVATQLRDKSVNQSSCQSVRSCDCILAKQVSLWQFSITSTEENHSNEHDSYEIPPLTNFFGSPIILSLDSLLKKKSPKTNCD